MLAFLLKVPVTTKFMEPGSNKPPDALSAILGSTPLAGLIPMEKGLILKLDASISENHSLEADSPDLPLEFQNISGVFSVNDQYIRKPRKLEIEGSISDSPVQYLGAITAGVGAITNMAGVMSPSLNAWQTLVGMHKNAAVFDVVTGLDLYKYMVIESINVKRDAMTGRQLSFTARLKQLNIVYPTKAGSSLDDIYATEAELGYLSAQIPDAVTILQSAAFLVLVGVQLLQ